MENQDRQQLNIPPETDETPASQRDVPIGIERIREEWRSHGLVEREVEPEAQEQEAVVFSEVDGGPGVGDYVVELETVKYELSLSDAAIDRLLSSGEIDSVVVRSSEGEKRRLVSRSSLNRFKADSAIDSEAVNRVARQAADKGVVEALEDLQAEIDELRNTQGKILQQMKDILLLEVRNLKDQERDLTSFVYELAEEIRAALPKKKRK